MITPYEHNGYQITVRDLIIHFQCAGEGPIIIMIHGGGNDCNEWRENIQFLSKNFKVYALDLPGFGNSETPKNPVTPHSFAEILKGFMEQLGVERSHIVGHSLGGSIALSLALDYPEMVDKVVIVDSGGLGQTRVLGKILLSFFGVLQKTLGIGKKPKCQYGGNYDDWYFKNRLTEIGQEVLIIWGGLDPYFSISEAKLANKSMKNSQLQVFNFCGHAPQRCDANRFNQIVSEFLSETP